MSAYFMKEPCANCPFRRDVRPFLRLERAEDLAYAATNPYSEFYCHKTLAHDDEDDETYVSNTSLICAGFLSMQINESGMKCPDGFSPSQIAYDDAYEMVAAYEDEEEGCWSAPRWLKEEA